MNTDSPPISPSLTKQERGMYGGRFTDKHRWEMNTDDVRTNDDSCWVAEAERMGAKSIAVSSEVIPQRFLNSDIRYLNSELERVRPALSKKVFVKQLKAISEFRYLISEF
jgi:hypothetical protein